MELALLNSKKMEALLADTTATTGHAAVLVVLVVFGFPGISLKYLDSLPAHVGF